MLRILFLFLCFHNSIQFGPRSQRGNGNEISTLEGIITEFKSFSDDLLTQALNQDDIDDLLFYTTAHREIDEDFNAQQMIEYRGFKYEEHKAVTEDCFVLTLHRIVNPYDRTPNKPPILLQHGLEDSSTAFLINTINGHINDDDDRNLGFALAKRGYDVWLGNFRGNEYSREHTTYSEKDPEYWRFTVDNHALQDLPAQIAYIQSATNFDKISYIGYSQGSTAAFILLSMKPEVSNALSTFIALAPVAFNAEMNAPFKYFAYAPGLMKRLAFQNSIFITQTPLQKKIVNLMCRSFNGYLCRRIMYLFAGNSVHQINGTRIPVYLNHMPAGTSTPNIVHFGQLIRSKSFELFNYLSEAQNAECYDSSKQPRIPLESINMPEMLLFNSYSDKLADLADVERLKRSLTGPFYTKTVEVKEFNHADFIYSQKADKYVNIPVIKFLESRVPTITGLRLKLFNARTCKVLDANTRCHLYLEHTLRNII